MRRALATSIARADFWRRPAWEPDRSEGHREWLHFSIADRDLTLLVNMSVVDDLRVSSPRGSEHGRVVVLLREHGSWDGGAEDVASEDLEVHGGQIFATIGDTHIEQAGDGVFHLTGKVAASGASTAISFDLMMRPLSFPSVASNVALGRKDELLNWVVVPTLLANGWIRIGERTREIRDLLTYHDHNWGYFSHENFAWEWGHAFPNNRKVTSSQQPGSTEVDAVVFTRLLNGAQTETFMQALLLWRDGRQYRVFREHELEVSTEGFLRKGSSLFTVPRTMSLLAGGGASATTDIPKRLHIRAEGRGDSVALCFETEDAARIVVPNEHDLGTTLIHEVVGSFELRGHVRGDAIDFTGHGVFEFLGRGP